MASTYSTSLRLELMATGDQSGTWGDTTNTNLGTLLEQAITGYLSVAQGDVANLTLTTVNGGTDQARNAVVRITGALTATRNVVVQTAAKLYTLANDTTGGFSIVAKTAAGTGVSIPPGAMIDVYSDGTNVVASQNYWSGQIGGAVYLDAGATVGPVMDLFRDSTSPAASDILGQVIFNGRDSAGNKQEYASIQSTILDATSTSEDSTLDFYEYIAGSRVNILSLAAGTSTFLYTDAGAAVGPVLDLYRNSASPAANDILGQIIFNGQDSGAAKQEYGSIQSVIIDATAASEDASLDFYAPVAGARTLIASLGPGITGAVIATQAQQETATSLATIVTPGRQQFHPSAAKAWGLSNATLSALTVGYNVTSVTDGGAGIVSFNLTVAFSSGSYAVAAGIGFNTLTAYSTQVQLSTSSQITMYNVTSLASTPTDPGIGMMFAAYGDQ